MNRSYTSQKLTDPDRLEVRDAENPWLATFTLNAYTVTLNGPEREFKECYQDPDDEEREVCVKHQTWVRTLPTPFDGQLNCDWLTRALEANRKEVPDILAIAMQYIKNAPPLVDENGVQIAGDACYGPEEKEEREIGADFNDYLGICWQYDEDGTDHPEDNEFRSLDCSGFMRMIWGYRNNFLGANYVARVPLSLEIRSDCPTIPRRSEQICVGAPGIIVIPNQNVRVTNFEKLRVGDLLFFDSHEDCSIKHVGMFIGVDVGVDVDKKHRFISSRKSINGPTLSDYNGCSVLEGEGLYARSFRAVRRL
jgi:hypothetical protein